MKALLKDRVIRWLFVGGFIYAFFFGQGIPLWDDDFTSWFWKIKDYSLFKYVFEWISPISTQPQYWGFNERPVQALVYKLCYLISGYESWSYMLYKDLVYAGLGVMVYLWSLRLVPAGNKGKWAAIAAAIFYILTPGTMAAHVIHSDLATTAELWFLILTYFIWDAVEKTPETWTGTLNFKDNEQKKWIKNWAILSFFVYLGYKSKADLKVIPAIFAAYIAILPTRRKQWKIFLVPFSLMVLLAVPWGPGIFTKLPPFVPGSQGSEIGWMWQPASFERLREFVWSSVPYSFFGHFTETTLSLAGLLGPFLLIGMVAFLIWRMEAFDKVPWRRLTTSIDRARTFALLWLVLIIGAVSALPAINYVFRIRYGIITMVPASLLLAWVFGLFLESSSRLHVWLFRLGILIFAIQASSNLARSVDYRRDMGQVMISTDQVYEYANTQILNAKLTLLPDFRPYDYRPDAGAIIKEKVWLNSADELKTKFKPFETYVISWNPSLWEELEVVRHFSGCRETTVFDRVFPCPKGTGTFLMRYIGRDPLYTKGEELRGKGDAAGALKYHEEFLAKYPLSMAGLFVIGLEAGDLRNWTRFDQAYGVLERYFPDHLAIMYNRALALSELGRYYEAIKRFKFILSKEPSNYSALINLFYSLKKVGKMRKAKETLIKMKQLYPQDQEIEKLLTSF